MQTMGLQAIYPRPNLSGKHPAHKIYPYLLRGVEIVMPDQVWSADITYIRMQHGFLYLAAVMDWFSRYVISWRLSNSLDSHFCIEALEEALKSGRPSIFNSDQGVQFTSLLFVFLNLPASRSVWMGAGGLWTMSLWNAYGVR